LSRCLERITAGETASACLARYPSHAAELAPLLAMAHELETLGNYNFSDAARERTRARLRQAEAARRDRRIGLWWQPGSLFAPRAVAGLAAPYSAFLTAGMVAAANPATWLTGCVR
jgi:hypothetical protein